MWRTELASFGCWRTDDAVCTVAVLVGDGGPMVYETRVQFGERQVYARTHETREAALTDADDLRQDWNVST